VGQKVKKNQGLLQTYSAPYDSNNCAKKIYDIYHHFLATLSETQDWYCTMFPNRRSFISLLPIIHEIRKTWREI